MNRFSLALLLVAASAAAPLRAQQVSLASPGGDAWTFRKPIEGTIEGTCDDVIVSGPAADVVATQLAGKFVAVLPLQEGINEVRATCRSNGTVRTNSAPQRWTVRLQDRPKAWPRIVTGHRGLVFDSGASEAASARPAPIVQSRWRIETMPERPGIAAGEVATITGRRVDVTVPSDGDYRITLTVADALGRSDSAVTTMRVRHGAVTPLDPMREHPPWSDSAIVYGAVPFLFGPRGLADVTQRLDAIAALGATAIWLSPLTASPGQDFGYAVTDHFALRKSFGSEEDLRKLIAAAHDRGLRVLLDFVPNHFSDQHPYYQDAAANGPASPYSAYFDRDSSGAATSYFNWSNLKNLNFDNEEVQRYVVEAFAHWVRAFDVDGFRVDASWGIRERAPEFWPRWRAELKRIKPDLLLLAEATAKDGYYLSHGFDAVYDWTDKLGEWSWQAAFERDGSVAQGLRRALSDFERANDQNRVFRFLNNNDTGARFMTRHGVPMTRVAAAMLLTLPGIPLIYAGQEIGAEYEPYASPRPIDWSTDANGLHAFYARLIALRAQSPPLHSAALRLLEMRSAQVLAYLRPGKAPEDDLLVALNFSGAAADLSFTDPAVAQRVGSGHATDLITGKPLTGDAVQALPAFGARLWRWKSEQLD
jgi:glycosidase